MSDADRTAEHVLNAGHDEASPRIMRLRRIGAVMWPSFFAAAVATFVFFAIVDPSELVDITWPHLAISRQFGYSIGFFMFWACTIASSAFTALLLSARVKRACIECRRTGGTK
jgi:hypothetical protein